MDSLLKNTVIIDHPLIAHKVTHLRDVYTGSKEFCELVTEITMLMGYEALRDLNLKNITVTAPLRTFESPVLAEDFTIVPILRAGLGMVEGLRSLSPTAKVGHIGLYRDEQTLEAKEYYFKLPADADKGQCLIVDPALATGATAVAAIDLLKSVGVDRIKFMCIFSSLTGISAVHAKHPDVTIFTASYSDEPLNDKGYIYTAAGDAGDRICGTVSYKPWPR